jgi:hypothetical protein
MEFKRILIADGGYVQRDPDGALGARGISNYITLGMPDQARKYAEAILELIGDEPKPKGDDCYIMVVGSGSFVGKTIHDAIPWESKDPTTGFLDNYHYTVREEFHVFRRVATVGPIPQPSERKVTRYE